MCCVEKCTLLVNRMMDIGIEWPASLVDAAGTITLHTTMWLSPMVNIPHRRSKKSLIDNLDLKNK